MGTEEEVAPQQLQPRGSPALCPIALLTLQAWPHPVFEGDALTLRCQGRKHAVLSHVRFYKDGSYLPSSEDNPSLTLGTATAASSGQYSCTAQVTYILYAGTQTSETIMVQVQGESPAWGWGGLASRGRLPSGCAGCWADPPEMPTKPP